MNKKNENLIELKYCIICGQIIHKDQTLSLTKNGFHAHKSCKDDIYA